jgi:hypothetical protein
MNDESQDDHIKQGCTQHRSPQPQTYRCCGQCTIHSLLECRRQCQWLSHVPPIPSKLAHRFGGLPNHTLTGITTLSCAVQRPHTTNRVVQLARFPEVRLRGYGVAGQECVAVAVPPGSRSRSFPFVTRITPESGHNPVGWATVRLPTEACDVKGGCGCSSCSSSCGVLRSWLASLSVYYGPLRPVTSSPQPRRGTPTMHMASLNSMCTLTERSVHSRHTISATYAESTSFFPASGTTSEP